MQRSVILVGASVRSLAESAVKTGLLPCCCDMFGDTDLRRLLSESGCPSPVTFSRFSHLPKIISQFPADVPLVWTGGLENDPQTLQQLADQRPVTGPSARHVKAARDLRQLRTIVDGTGCRLPETTSLAGRIPVSAADERWLIKPARSSGGLGIRAAHHGQTIGPDEYAQQFVDGFPVSGLYCTDGLTTRLMGASLQIAGELSLGGHGFAYCGNIGPVRLAAHVHRAITEIGCRIGAHGMMGVFGVDFVVGPDTIWLMEVNPRITASQEICDFRAAGDSVLERHMNPRMSAAADGNADREGPQHSPMLARLIVYQRHDYRLQTRDADHLWQFRRGAVGREQSSHWVADIPHPGILRFGQPCCSVYHILHHDEAGWSADVGSTGQEINRIVSRISGIHELDTSGVAVRYASLFENSTASDNNPVPSVSS